MTFEEIFRNIPGASDFVASMPKIWPISLLQDIYAPFGALHLVGLALMAIVVPGLGTAVLLRGCARVLKQSIWSNSTEQLHTPLSGVRRGQARSAIRGVLAPGGYAILGNPTGIVPQLESAAWPMQHPVAYTLISCVVLIAVFAPLAFVFAWPRLAPFADVAPAPALRAPVRHRGEWRAPATIEAKTWLFLVLSGIATGLSWLCYYRALQLGPVGKVAPIDKLSVAIAIVLGFVAVLYLVVSHPGRLNYG